MKTLLFLFLSTFLFAQYNGYNKYSNYVSDDGFISYMSVDANTKALWLFEGNGADEVGTYDLVEIGTPTYITTTKMTQSAVTSAGNKFNETDNLDLSAAGSLEAIVKRPISTSGVYWIFRHYAANNRLYLSYRFTAGSVYYAIGEQSDTDAVGADIANDGNYHYVVLTWNGTSCDLWLDGSKIVDADTYDAGSSGVNLTEIWEIGGRASEGLQTYTDEIRLSDKVRSDAEIAAVWSKF